jgi:hypothetical protein
LGTRQIVGVLAADGVALEILPKIDVPGADNSSGYGPIRQRLVHMLGVALDLDIAAGAMTELSSQKETILEILIGLFARKLVDEVRKGMPRRYLAHEDDLTAVRGQLDITRQFTTLIARPDRLARLRSVNDGVTSAFEVLAANFGIRDPGSGERTEYRSGNWYVYSPSENTRTRYGRAFGGSQKLVWWTGPSSVAEGSETKANAYVYMSQNTVSGPRFGGSDIVGGSGVLTATASSLIVQGGRNGAGGVSTSTTTATAAGGNSGASMRWVKVSSWVS